MIQNILRFCSIVILMMFIMIQDIYISKYIKDKTIQLYLSLLIIFIIMFIDNVSGFILGISLLVIYFKIYHKELKHKKTSVNKINDTKCHGDKGCFLDNVDGKENNDNTFKKTKTDPDIIELDYITEQHLLSAQNNIVDTENYNKELIGIDKSMRIQKVYGAQGLDNDNNHFMGDDKSILSLGNLSYSIIDK